MYFTKSCYNVYTYKFNDNLLKKQQEANFAA